MHTVRHRVTRRRTGLRRTLVRRLVSSALVTAGVAAGAVAAGNVVAAEEPPSRASTTRSAQAERVAALLGRHHCWSSDAPPGAPIPGHAVVTLPGAQPRLVASSVGFGIWLEGDPGTLHGFCP